MNSYYHPREHDDREGEDGRDGMEASGHKHCNQSHGFPPMPMAYVRHDYQSERTEHEGEVSERVGGQPREDVRPHDDKNGAMYRVLVAVERGELSAQDAARKLEELEARSWGRENPELL